MSKEFKLITVSLSLIALGVIVFFCPVNITISEEKAAANNQPDDMTPIPDKKIGSSDSETMPVEVITPTHYVLPIFKMGDELKVDEEQKWDGTMVIKTDGLPQSYPYSKLISQQYTEKLVLVTADQLSLKSERNYLSSVIKSQMPDEGKKTMATSLEGKTLALESKDYQIISYEKLAPKDANIINEDYAYINSFNWFYTCLPGADTPVTMGSAYPIKNSELAKAIFKGQYNEKSCVVIGNGVLEEVGKSRKILSTRILINIKIKQKVDDIESNVELIGFCKLIAGGDAPSLEMEISGPFTITKALITHEDKKILSSTSGSLRVKSKVALKKQNK